jgi:hypothetical protein
MHKFKRRLKVIKWKWNNHTDIQSEVKPPLHGELKSEQKNYSDFTSLSFYKAFIR